MERVMSVDSPFEDGSPQEGSGLPRALSERDAVHGLASCRMKFAPVSNNFATWGQDKQASLEPKWCTQFNAGTSCFLLVSKSLSHNH
jgi:hypothetical protein